MQLMLSFEHLLPGIETRARAIHACNAISQPFGLSLSFTQAAEVAESHSKALQNTQRVEFGGEIPQKLIYAFCDSPFIAQADYAQTLSDLLDTFYHYKNELGTRLSDDELIAFMQARFNGICQGSLDLLRHRELELLAKRMRGWEPPAPGEDSAALQGDDEDE